MLLVIKFEQDQALPEEVLALFYKTIDLTFSLNYEGGRDGGRDGRGWGDRENELDM